MFRVNSVGLATLSSRTILVIVYCKKICSFFFSYAKLKASCDSQKNMQKSCDILTFSDHIYHLPHWQPLLVFMANNDCDNLLVEFDEFVSFVTSHHCQDQCILNMLFLSWFKLFFFGRPPYLDGIFELNESSLLNINL